MNALYSLHMLLEMSQAESKLGAKLTLYTCFFSFYSFIEKKWRTSCSFSVFIFICWFAIWKYLVCIGNIAGMQSKRQNNLGLFLYNTMCCKVHSGGKKSLKLSVDDSIAMMSK